MYVNVHNEKVNGGAKYECKEMYNKCIWMYTNVFIAKTTRIRRKNNTYPLFWSTGHLSYWRIRRGSADSDPSPCTYLNKALCTYSTCLIATRIILIISLYVCSILYCLEVGRYCSNYPHGNDKLFWVRTIT